MRIAVIDMGTNTFHLLLAEVVDRNYSVLYRDRVAVKIGEGGITEGFINREAIQRALTTLKYFKTKAEELQIVQIFATATSAVRSASNGQEMVDLIRKETGIEIKIISGDEEAEAIYFGVSKALNLGDDCSLIMDVGGGSIEFIIGNQSGILWKQSFEMGGQRLLDRFHQSDPIDDSELNSMNAFIEENLEPLFKACDTYNPRTLVGSSGTFDTLSEIYSKKEGVIIDSDSTELPLSIDGFNDIFRQVISSNRLERLQIPGMIEMRVDMIVVASALVSFIIEKVGIERIRVSSFALKEGILLKTIETLATDKT